jgi:hypothetical protein
MSPLPGSGAPIGDRIVTVGSVLKELALEAGKGAVQAIARLVRRRPKEPPHPTWKDVEHMRAQERASIEASKKARK